MSRRVFIILLYIIFTLATTWQVVTLTRDWTLRTLHQQGSDELLKVITQLRGALDQYRYLPFLISQDTDVKELMLGFTESKGDEVSLYLEQTNLVAGSSSLFVLNAHGKPIAYSHWRDERDFFLRLHQDQDYYRQALAGHRGRQFSLNAESQSPAYFLSSPIYDGKRFTGVAVVRIELEKLISQLRSFGVVLLSDENDQLFFSTGPFQRFSQLGTQIKSRQENLTDGITTELWEQSEGNWLARGVSLDDLQWRVTLLQDLDVVQRNVRNASLFSFGGCIALGLMVLLFRERQLKIRSQNETREALAASEAQQKAIINNAQVGLLLIDSKGCITFANEMALQQFAASAPLLMHKPLLDLLSSEGVSPIQRLLSRLDHKGFSPLIGFEAVAVRGDGTEFPIMLSIRKMQALVERQYLVTIIDISRRKGLELQLKRANESLEHKVEERTQALQEAQDELVQAGKMAAIGRMSTAVVHELNQPLTAIRNYVAICRQMLQQPEMLSESLTEVDELTQRMAQITSQLKTFAYRKPEQMEKVSVQMAVNNALHLFRQRFIDDGFQVDLDLPEQTVYVLGDSARLEQVLLNLIKNALDAMQGFEHKQIAIRVDVVDDKVQLTVVDSGPGIDMDLLPDLFEPFVTSKSIGDGLGLGLSIVRSIVRDLNGEISAENQTGGGACFRVILPQSK
jgi:two-component system C4-dicarboxylate transport sensor histidine kinase DctB